MGVRILIGTEQGDTGINEKAVLFDSVTGWAFGPVIDEHEDGTSAEDMAELFVDWLTKEGHEDARALSSEELKDLYDQWSGARE